MLSLNIEKAHNELFLVGPEKYLPAAIIVNNSENWRESEGISIHHQAAEELSWGSPIYVYWLIKGVFRTLNENDYNIIHSRPRRECVRRDVDGTRRGVITKA